MENIFDTIDDSSHEIEVEFTKDEFIIKAKALLTKMLELYQNSHDAFNDDENEESTCSRCNGFLYIEQGGVGDVDCPNCNGTGKNLDVKLDVELFAENIEHKIIFGSEPFFELINCKII